LFCKLKFKYHETDNYILFFNNFIYCINVEGYFEIPAKPLDTLIVSYLGYTTKVVAIANQKEHIHLKLEGQVALEIPS